MAELSQLTQLKLLINLSRIDGEVAERERNYINTIGQANGISEKEIGPLYDQNHEIIIPEKLTADQKFQYLFSLVQLMKIDERLYKDEIQYCAKVSSKLGYGPGALFDFILHVKATSSMISDEGETLKKLIAKHLL